MAKRTRRRIKLAAPSAWRDVGTARLFQNKYARLRRYAARQGVRNGYIIRIFQSKLEHTTTMLDIPQRIAGRQVFREVEEFDDGANGEAAYYADIRGVRAVGLDREYLFDNSTMEPPEQGEALFTGELGQPAPKAEAYLGGPPPDDAFEVNISYAEPQPSHLEAVTYRLETTLMSNVRLAYSTDYKAFNQNAHYPLDKAYTPADISLWLRFNFMASGGKGYHFYVSEQWLQELPELNTEYRLVSFLYRETLASPESTGFGNGVDFYVQTVLRRTIEDYVYPANDVSDWRQDNGHCALVTLALRYEDEELELVWHHVWKLEDETDPRLLTKVRPTGIDDYPLSNGVSENGIKPKLYAREDGALEGLLAVCTSATAFYGSGSTNVDGGGSVPEVSLVRATWDSDGTFEREVLFSNTPLSTITHDKSWNYGGGDITDIGARQGIFSQGQARWLPLEICSTPHEDTHVYLSTYLAVVAEGSEDSYTFLTTSLQGNDYYLNVANRCMYAITDAETDATLASWDEGNVGYSPYAGGQVNDVVLMHYGTFDAVLTQGLAIGCGAGTFCAISLATDNNAEYAEGTFVLLVMSADGEFEAKPLPSAGTAGDGEQAATSIYCYQKRIYDDQGDVDTRAGLVLGMAGRLYLSNDEGDNWIKVADHGFFAPTLVFSSLWKPIPFDPKGSLGG